MAFFTNPYIWKSKGIKSDDLGSQGNNFEGFWLLDQCTTKLQRRNNYMKIWGYIAHVSLAFKNSYAKDF